MSYHHKGYYDDGDVSPPGEHYPSRERHRQYDREWDRGKETWDWESDHPRRRSRSRSLSRERRSRRDKKKRDWSSDSESSRSRSRSRERRRRSRSRSRDRNRRERDRPMYDEYREREPERNDTWKSAAPNCTIMVSNLPLHITENEIRTSITSHGLVAKDIRLIRRKDTGTSRGFAFVEFIRLPEAVRWMETNQGYLLLENQYQATLQYSISKDSYNDKMAKAAQDWFCIHCGEHNFKRREVCFKCQAPRSESELIGDVQKEISPYPTNTVLLRNLDALTTEDRVLSILQTIPGVATLPIKSVRIGRDPLSNISRGVCYLDMNNTGDAMRVYAGLCELGRLEIDGKEVAISYCKQANSSISTATMAAIAANASTPVGATAVAAAQWSVSNAQNTPQAAGTSGEVNFTAEEIPRLAEYSASLYAKSPEEHASHLEYYKKYYADQLRAANSKKQASQAPDLSKYVYDEKSGYYYDASTNLYYDAKTQYFYNPLTQQFSYWDSDSNCFVPVAGNDQQSTSQATAEQKEEKKEKPGKQDKVTVAKKIAKDMEKWAKTLNQKKEMTKVAAPAPAYEPPVERRREPEPAAEKDSLNEVLQVFHKKQLAEKKALGASALVTYGSDSDSDGLDEKKFAELLEGLIDWTKLACLLCKRQFNNRETLVKHQQLSDLHKQNLEAWKKQHTPKTYRDRAKERRMKFGEDSPPRTKQDFSSRKRSEPEPTSFEQPSPSGVASNNVGSKLLQKMGWQEGQGLGKSNQGRTTIIEAERRSAQAGLGMKTYGVAGDDYRASVRKCAMMRFKELNEQN